MPRLDLARVVDLAAQLEADAQVDPDTLRRRDRTLGRALSERTATATARLHAWLDGRRSGDGPSAGVRALRAQRILRALLAVAGLASGAGAALIFFAYDGTHPVNVVQLLAFFVALQALLLGATALLALPEAWRRFVPGLGLLQDVLAVASPGRWQPALGRLLAPAQRAALERVTGLAQRHQRLFGEVQKWSWLVASQGFALSFHAAALLTALALVSFSDLAFGWSTTLDLDAAWLERVVHALAMPWASVWSAAVPDRSLIEATQYFRGGGGAPVDASESAAWWRFVVMCMVCYGLLPRALSLALAAWRQHVALARVFESWPGVAGLHDRLGASHVETIAEGGEEPGIGGAPRQTHPQLPRPARVLAIRWSGLALSDADGAQLLRDRLGADVAGTLEAGAGSERSDASLVAEIAASELTPVWLVKGWEPPLGELLDLFGELRSALGDGRAIFVLPLLLTGSADDALVWQRRLDTLGDPWLEVLDPGSAP